MPKAQGPVEKILLSPTRITGIDWKLAKGIRPTWPTYSDQESQIMDIYKRKGEGVRFSAYNGGESKTWTILWSKSPPAIPEPTGYNYSSKPISTAPQIQMVIINLTRASYNFLLRAWLLTPYTHTPNCRARWFILSALMPSAGRRTLFVWRYNIL